MKNKMWLFDKRIDVILTLIVHEFFSLKNLQSPEKSINITKWLFVILNNVKALYTRIMLFCVHSDNLNKNTHLSLYRNKSKMQRLRQLQRVYTCSTHYNIIVDVVRSFCLHKRFVKFSLYYTCGFFFPVSLEVCQIVVTRTVKWYDPTDFFFFFQNETIIWY